MKTFVCVLTVLSTAALACGASDTNPSNGSQGGATSSGAAGAAASSSGFGGGSGASASGDVSGASASGATSATTGSASGANAGGGTTGVASTGASALDAGDASMAAPTDGATRTGDADSANGEAGPSSGSPLLAVLSQFSAPDVPAKGPNEAAPGTPTWTAPATLPVRPGNGLGQHPMLYAGEGYNTLFVVNGGKVIWTYATAPGGEIDDVWMLSNAHVLYTHSDFVEELTPKKAVVWHYVPPAGTQIHTCQPIGLDRVLLVENGQPPKAKVINKTTGLVELEHALDAAPSVHGQFRRFRKTAAGTYLAPYLSLSKLLEYDKDFNVIWTYPATLPFHPWAAIRLQNGNTLIQIEGLRSAREVDIKGATVWEFTPTDLPAGLMQRNTQTSDRLANGNTVIFSPGTDPNVIQAIEVTPAKKVVWVLQDWKDLGPATAAQFLDEPGIPENPGELQH